MKENLHYKPLHCIDKEKLLSTDPDELRWVVMRSLHSKVLMPICTDGKQTVTRKYGYENAEHLFCEFFMPIKEIISVINGRRIIRHEPAIAGMFFVRDKMSNIRNLSSGKLGFELRFLKGRKYQEPVVIDNKEMNTFIESLRTASEIRFFSPEDKELKGKIGKKVRIYKDDSYFEGRIISVRGSKRRWLRMSIEGFLVAEMEFDLNALQSSGQIVELLD